jgi:riboflavin kinase/FMN adenylyltransferase
VALSGAKLLPGDGVYLVSFAVEGSTWPGVASVSDNPTFQGKGRRLEVHLLSFDGNLYGRKVTVRFLRWLRESRRFPSAADLSEQVGRDRDRAAELWATLPKVATGEELGR